MSSAKQTRQEFMQAYMEEKAWRKEHGYTDYSLADFWRTWENRPQLMPAFNLCVSNRRQALVQM